MANVAYQGMDTLKIDAKAIKSSSSRGNDKDATVVALRMPSHMRSKPATYIIDAVPGIDPKSPFAQFLSADRWYPKPGSNPKGNTEIHDVHIFADGSIALIAAAWQFTTKGLDPKVVAALNVMDEVLADRAKTAKPKAEKKAKRALKTTPASETPVVVTVDAPTTDNA